ncbi:MAG: sterol desaturase family protein [Sphingomicrobium sp.]
MLIDVILHDAVRTLGGLLVGLGLFRAIELLFPQRGVEAPSGHLTGLRIWFVYVGAQIVLTVAVIALMHSADASPNLDPRVLLGLPTWAAAIVVGIVVILAKDFFFYWEHRVQHRWLWRWHMPHHAIRNLSATNSWHHWSEILMFALFVSVPMGLLTPAFGPRSFIVGLILSWQPIYLHSSTRLQMGKLARRIIVDSRYHRIHHSLEPRHFDRNFGAATPLWDWMFGTLYLPDEDEWPEVGLAGVDEPSNVREWALLPWTARAKMPKLKEGALDGR